MSKKLSNAKSINVMHISSLDATRMKMPKYNAHQIGHGVIGDVKYNRNKDKRIVNKRISDDLD